MDWNKVFLSGRISKMEGKTVNSSKSKDGQLFLVNLNLAVNYYDYQAKEEKPLFIPVTVFGKTAENLQKYMEVGDQLYVFGELRPNNWESKKGEKHFGFQLEAKELNYGRKKGDFVKGKSEKQQPPMPQSGGFYPLESDFPDDDLPF